MTGYCQPKVSARAVAQIEQGFFDFLVPYKNPLLRPDQCAKSLNRGVNFIYDLLAEGKLEAHGVPGREKERYQITKRSLLLYLAESANYDPADFETRAEALVDTLTADQLTRLIVRATARRAKL